MKQQRPQNIEHLDLTETVDKHLEIEAEYLFKHAAELMAMISAGFIDVTLALSDINRKHIEDLRLTEDRFLAIIEEMNYRAQMMR